MVIGTIGSIILTASSMFVALKASSLPWPIMFVTLFSMCLLKLMGNTNVNEINVTHTAMSAGSMVAGGLAFTIPGLFILDNNAQIGVLEIGVCTITGTILDATMSTVTIQTEDGEELSFSIPDDADETEVDGMTVGDTLEITYTGTIDGTATVVKLVQTSAQ